MPNSLSITSYLLACFCALATLCQPCQAQNEKSTDSAKSKKNDIEMLECRVKVVDPDGFAVEDATVFCTGLRSKEEPGSHWGWGEELLGKLPRIQTDSEGIAVMPYPKQLSEEFSTGQMTWSVEHPAFVNYRRDHSVDDDPAEIVLERGFRIALTAKRADGEKIMENLHAVASFEGGGKWELKKNGMLVSSVMKKQDGILRVAFFDKDKPTLFSNEIEIKPGDKSRVLLKDIELSPGCWLKGSLDESVDRPVKNGYVIACIYKRDPELRRSSWRWADEAPIDADGNFEFESLPKGEAIQMIPICDGFVPAKPTAEEVLGAIQGLDPNQVNGMIGAFRATPQVVKAEESEATKILKMTKAPSVTVKVVDQNGVGVPDVRVATAPNQYWFQGGSQILGGSYPTRKIWEIEKSGVDLATYYKNKMHPYMLRTDKNGVVTFKTMPAGQHDFGVYEQEWEMKKDLMSGERSKQIQVRDSDREITIELFPKGSLPRGEDGALEQSLGEALNGLWNELTGQAK